MCPKQEKQIFLSLKCLLNCTFQQGMVFKHKGPAQERVSGEGKTKHGKQVMASFRVCSGFSSSSLIIVSEIIFESSG